MTQRNTSVDPFDFFPKDISQYIIQLTNASVNQLVSYMKVCRGWYSIISESKQLWQSMKVIMNAQECTGNDIATIGAYCDGRIARFEKRFYSGMYVLQFGDILRHLTSNFSRKLYMGECIVNSYCSYMVADVSLIRWICCPSWEINFSSFSAANGCNDVLIPIDAQDEFVRNTVLTPLVQITITGGSSVPRFSAETLLKLIETNKATLKIIKFHDLREVFDKAKVIELSKIISQCKHLEQLYLWNSGIEDNETFVKICENVPNVQCEYNPKCYHFNVNLEEEDEIGFVVTPSWKAPTWDDCSWARNILPPGFCELSEGVFEFEGSETEGRRQLLEIGCVHDLSLCD